MSDLDPGKREDDPFADCRGAIRDVLERYFAGVDRRDFDLIVSCFHAEGTFSSTMPGFQAVRGHLAIRSFFETFPRKGGSIHVLSNFTLTRQDGRTVSDSRAIVHLAGDKGGAMLVRGIRYRDEWVSAGGGWRIVRREHEPLWQYSTRQDEPDLRPASNR